MENSRFGQKILARVILGTSLLLGACATEQLMVVSNPEGADVLLHRTDLPPMSVGKTPLHLNRDLVPGLFKESVQISLSKEGYQTEAVLVPRSHLQGSGRIFFSLHETKVPSSCTNQEVAANELARGVATAQLLVMQKNYSEAELLLKDLSHKYPSVAVLHDLLGNIHYLKRDLYLALASYKRSNQLQPNQPATLKLIDKLSTILGIQRGETGRLPSSGE